MNYTLSLTVPTELLKQDSVPKTFKAGCCTTLSMGAASAPWRTSSSWPVQPGSSAVSGSTLLSTSSTGCLSVWSISSDVGEYHCTWRWSLKHVCGWRWWWPLAPSEGLLSNSKDLPVPMGALRGDSVVEKESAEPAVSLEQLKNDRSYRKMLFKSGYMKLEGAEPLTGENGKRQAGRWKQHRNMASDKEHGSSGYGQLWRWLWPMLPPKATWMPLVSAAYWSHVDACLCGLCAIEGHDGVCGLCCGQEPWAIRMHQVFAVWKIYYIHEFGGMESRGRMTGFECLQNSC